MNRTIFYLFLILLIWTPFAFGSVHALAYSLLELHVFFLIVLGMAQGIFTRRRAFNLMKTIFMRISSFLPAYLRYLNLI